MHNVRLLRTFIVLKQINNSESLTFNTVRMNNLSTTPRVFVSDYASYNEGMSHCGKWVELNNYDTYEEFLEGVEELFAELDQSEPLPFGAKREEAMFLDYEGFPANLYNESCLAGVFEYVNAMKSLDTDQEEAFEAYCSNWNIHDSWQDAVEDFQDRYSGDYSNSINPRQDFAYDLVEDTGMLAEVPETIKRYFDYEAFERDLFLGDYTEIDGFIFRDC